MPRFRKKSIEVEARQLPVNATPAQAIAVYQWVESHIGSVQPAGDEPDYTPVAAGVTIDPADGFMVIRTLEGDMKVSLGDWVIRGVSGEFYPCKPGIFEQTYDPVREPDPAVKTPLGHSIASHVLLGWCLHCPGRSVAEEVCAWQVWAGRLPHVAAEIRRQQPGGDGHDGGS